MEMRRRKLHPDKEEEDRSSAKDKDTNLRRSKRKAQSTVETPVAEGQLDKDKSSTRSSRSRRRSSSVETPVVAKELDQGESPPRKSRSRPGSGIETSVAAGELDREANRDADVQKVCSSRRPVKNIPEDLDDWFRHGSEDACGSGSENATIIRLLRETSKNSEASLGMESNKSDVSIRHAAKHTDQLDDELLEYVDKNIHLFESDSDDFAETTPIQDEHNYNKVLDNSSETFHSLGSLESDADDDDKEVSVLKSSPSLLLPRSGSEHNYNKVLDNSSETFHSLGSLESDADDDDKEVSVLKSSPSLLLPRSGSGTPVARRGSVATRKLFDKDAVPAESAAEKRNVGSPAAKNVLAYPNRQVALRGRCRSVVSPSTTRLVDREPGRDEDVEDSDSSFHLHKKDKEVNYGAKEKDVPKNYSDSDSVKSATRSHDSTPPHRGKLGAGIIEKSDTRRPSSRKPIHAQDMEDPYSTAHLSKKDRTADLAKNDSDSSSMKSVTGSHGSATPNKNRSRPKRRNMGTSDTRMSLRRGSAIRHNSKSRAQRKSMRTPDTSKSPHGEPRYRDDDTEDSDNSVPPSTRNKAAGDGVKEKDTSKADSDSSSMKSVTRSHGSATHHNSKSREQRKSTRTPDTRKSRHGEPRYRDEDTEDSDSSVPPSTRNKAAGDGVKEKDTSKADSDSSSMKSVTMSHDKFTARSSATRHNSKSMAQRKSTRTPDTRRSRHGELSYREEDTDSDGSVHLSARNKATGDGVMEKDPSKADSDSSSMKSVTRSPGSASRHNNKSRLQRKSIRTPDATRKSLHRGRDHRKDVRRHGEVLDLSEEEADDNDAGSREDRGRAMSPDGLEGSIVIEPAKKRSGREHRKDVRKRGEVQHLSEEEADDNDAGSREDRGRAMSRDVSEGSVVIEPARKRRATVIQPKKAKRQRQSAIKANELLEKAQYSDDDIDEEDERKTDSDESLSGDDVDGEEHGVSGNLGGNAVKCRPCVVQLTRYLMDAGARSVFLSAAAVPKRGSGRPPKDAEGANSSAQGKGTNAAMQVDEDWSDNGVNSSSRSTSSSSSSRSSRSSSNRSRRDQSLSEGSSAPSSGPDTDYEPSGADSFVVEQDKSDSEEVIYHTRSKVRRKRRRKFRDVTKDHDHGSSYSSGSDLDYEPASEEDQGKTKSSRAVPDKVKQRLRKKVRKERNVLRSQSGSDSSSSSIFTSEGSNKASDYSDVDKDMPGPSHISRHVSSSDAENRSASNSDMEISQPGPSYISRHVSSSDAENRSASNSDMEISQPGPSTPLRGRGRPRKYISPSDAVESTPKSPSIPPRGRGRPRKDISPSDAVEQSPKSPSIPPRGRGRPRKDISPSDAVEQSPKSTSQRGRGRPRKNMNSSDAVEPSSKGTRHGSSRISLFDVDNQSSNNSDISDIENMKSGPVTPIRGKSRPRKAFGTSNESFPEHHDEDSALW